MKREHILEEINKIGKCYLYKELENEINKNIKDKRYIVVPRTTPEESELKSYVNLIIAPDGEDENNTIIAIENSDYAEDLFYLISNKIEDDLSLIEILEDINELLAKAGNDRNKFRGDYAEAAYLAYVGGEWVPGNEIHDIVHNGKNIEIKSFSPQSKTITMSHEQLSSDSIKMAYPLRTSSNGKTILDLAKLIRGSNPRFSDELTKKYENDYLQGNKKYEEMEFLNFTDQLDFEINVPEKVKKLEIWVQLEVNIKDLEKKN